MFKSEIDFRNSKPQCLGFPFEKLSAPVGKDNVWRRHIPKLKSHWPGMDFISGNAPDSFITDE